MAFLGAIGSQLSPLRESSSFLNTNTIIALTVFFTLLCACIVVGHLLEENRWANESITALLLVRSSTRVCVYVIIVNRVCLFLMDMI